MATHWIKTIAMSQPHTCELVKATPSNIPSHPYRNNRVHTISQHGFKRDGYVESTSRTGQQAQDTETHSKRSPDGELSFKFLLISQCPQIRLVGRHLVI